MNVNDLVCVGAEPIAMRDHLAIEEPGPEALAQATRSFPVTRSSACPRLRRADRAGRSDGVKARDPSAPEGSRQPAGGGAPYAHGRVLAGARQTRPVG